MNLDDAQRKKVATWIEEGAKLSDIQKRIETEFSLRLTYLDVRLLVDDLKLMPKDPVVPEPVKPEPAVAAAAVPVETELMDEAPLGTGNVSVTVDHIARPGTMVSGKTTFSDGNTADWYLDQTGRLGVSPSVQGYRPSQEDVAAFQTELQNVLAKMGL